ncbi:hypothetical protein [Oceanobacillus oncorhynchi]|uniref:hypothetical protein n=1 Tax=Oceanobacillus oncorhynchi TaxID=545501 RepID=UPI001869308D|nr:hypothetical protein [Oceanobacillus oncorhynchi]
MNISLFIDTILPLIIIVVSLIYQLRDYYEKKQITNPSTPANTDIPSHVPIPREDHSIELENKKTKATWLYYLILFSVYGALAVNIFLELQTTSALLIDDITGLPTLDKILNIAGISIQEVQQYLIYLIIGLLISMLIIAILKNQFGRIVYTILLAASAFMAHYIISTNAFVFGSNELSSLHNVIHYILPIILIAIFFFQLYLCNFIINRIFLPKFKSKLIARKVQNFIEMVIPVIFPFIIYIFLQI